MADQEDIRLQRMGLVQLPSGDENEVVAEEDFTKRTTLYGKLKDSVLTDNKAFAGHKTAFETTEYTGERQYVPCYLPVPIMKISGMYPNRQS